MHDGREYAETIGLRALSWLAGHEDLLPVFLGATGVSEADLRAAPDAPETLAAVLDFLLMDDAWVTAFCAQEGLGNDVPMRARLALPGGQETSWT